MGFPGGSVVKNPPASAGDAGSIPGLGRKDISIAALQIWGLLESHNICYFVGSLFHVLVPYYTGE